MNKTPIRTGVGVGLLAAAALGYSVTFSNVIFASAPLSDGATFGFDANSITFYTPNAGVGDAPGIRVGTLTIQYDADAGALMCAVEATVTLAQAILGSGTIEFTEVVYEIDEFGAIIGGPLASVAVTFDSNSSPIWSDTLVLSSCVQRLRAIKTFEMNAPETAGEDLAAVAINNQSITVVPEPTTIAGLGVASLALIRRRKK